MPRLVRGSSIAAALLASLSLPVLAQKDTTHVDKTFFTRRDAVLSGVALGGSAVISIFDKRIADWTQTPSVQGSQSRHDVVDALTHVNETPLTIGAVLTYGTGRLIHNKTVADIGLHLTESMVLTDVLSEAIRGPVGRARPRVADGSQYEFTFWAGFTDFAHRSFPSLHSAAAFSTAAVLASEIHERDPSASKWAAPLLYTAALIPGATRMYLNQHWASDIASGAFVGTLIGTKVVHYGHTHKPNKLERALLDSTIIPNGQGGVLASVSFTP